MPFLVKADQIYSPYWLGQNIWVGDKSMYGPQLPNEKRNMKNYKGLVILKGCQSSFRLPEFLGLDPL